jgi:tRNA threonylcarbamoyladenosine biosynthesis protein TsaB
MGLVVAFDTATHVATVAVLDDDEVIGEVTTRSHRVLAEAREVLLASRARPSDVEALVVGTGPGSFTGLRLGLALAQGFALARSVPVAGVSTLDALAAGAPGSIPLVDGGRREVFALVGGAPRSLSPGDLVLEEGVTCVGDGALHYRALLEAFGADVPPDEDERHVPLARHHVRLARASGVFGSAETIRPIYVRPPDAKVPA